MSEPLYLKGDFKAVIKLDSVGELTMDDYEFYAEYFTKPNRMVKVEKKDMVRKGENEYHVPLHTSDLGVGMLSCYVTRFIPDADFPSGMRTDRMLFKHGVPILE